MEHWIHNQDGSVKCLFVGTLDEANIFMEEGQYLGQGPDPQAQLAMEIRAQRDKLLQEEVDVIASNTLRWNELNESQKEAWAHYRYALLNLPQQPGFPNEVIWPAKPA